MFPYFQGTVNFDVHHTSQQVHQVEDQAPSDICSGMHLTHQFLAPETTRITKNKKRSPSSKILFEEKKKEM